MKRLMTIIIAMLFVTIASHAQDFRVPLFIVDDGYLYAWWDEDSHLEQLTFEGYVQGPVISPNGSIVAFNWHENREHMAIGGYEVGEDLSPSDIWVYGVEGVELAQITVQHERGVTVRSEPSWSADGSYLIWYEDAFYEGGGSRYVIYDYYNHHTEYISAPSGGIDAGNFAMWQTVWAGDSITQYIYGVEPNQRLLATDISGNRLFADEVSYFDEGGIYKWSKGPFNVVDDDGRSYIGIFYPEIGQWDVIDPHTGGRGTMFGYEMEMVARAAPYETVIQAQAGIDEWAMKVIGQDATLFLNLPENRGDSFAPWIAISSDGRSVAFVVANSEVHIWQDGDIRWVEGLNNPTDVVWGPTEWRIRDDDLHFIYNHGENWRTENCDTQGVVVGASGILAEWNIRGYYAGVPDFPAFDAGVLIDDTYSFTVLDGPVCDDENTYWLIDAEGIVAWVRDEAKVATTLHITQCPDGPESQIGTYKGVAHLAPDTKANNLRETVGLDGKIITVIQPGDTLRLVGSHPQCADGYLWHWVEYEGEYGWTAEGEINDYWIIPNQ